MTIKSINIINIYNIYYSIILASFYKDLYEYLMKFYIPLPNSTSFIEKSLLRNYLDV